MTGKRKDEPIDDVEEVARVIDAPSMLDEGEISPSAFSLCNELPKSGEKESYLSVIRTLFGYPEKESIIWAPRVKGDFHYGYGLLVTSDIRGVSDGNFILDVRAYPNRRNPGHAGILYFCEKTQVVGACQEFGFLFVTSILAKMSRLVVF